MNAAIAHPFSRGPSPSPSVELDARVLNALSRGDADALARMGTADLDTSVAKVLARDLGSLRPVYLRYVTTPRALAVVYGLTIDAGEDAAVAHELVLAYVGPASDRRLARVTRFGW